jgi:hypothetical protein
LTNDPVVTDSKSGSSFNRYSYSENNPYKYIDPDGRQSCGSYMCDIFKSDSTSSGSSLSTSILQTAFNDAQSGARIAIGESVVTLGLHEELQTTLWREFLNGRHGRYNLPESEFSNIFSEITKSEFVGNINFADGTAGQQYLINLYGSSAYAYTFGYATLYMQQGVPVGFIDNYDFNKGARTPGAEIATRIGDLFSPKSGKSGFNVWYGKQKAGVPC